MIKHIDTRQLLCTRLQRTQDAIFLYLNDFTFTRTSYGVVNFLTDYLSVTYFT